MAIQGSCKREELRKSLCPDSFLDPPMHRKRFPGQLLLVHSRLPTTPVRSATCILNTSRYFEYKGFFYYTLQRGVQGQVRNTLETSVDVSFCVSASCHSTAPCCSRPAANRIIMARQVKIEPFVYLFWLLLLIGWILMLSGNAALQQARFVL